MKSDILERPPSKFVVDQDQYVHLRWCPLLTTLPVEAYWPVINVLADSGRGPIQVPIKTATELMAWIARPDFKDGHYGPGILLACGSCVKVEAVHDEPRS